MGRPMGGEHEQTKAKAGPTKVATSSAPQPKPRPPHPRAQTISLLLRSRTHAIEAALTTTGKTRPAALIRAAADLATTVRMIDLVTDANGADFDEVIDDVVAMVLTLGKLEAALASSDLKGVKSDVKLQRELLADYAVRVPMPFDLKDRMRQQDIEKMIRAGSVDRARFTPPQKSSRVLSSAEQATLFKTALDDARAAIDRVGAKVASPEQCAPIASKLAMAGELALGIEIPQRPALVPTVAATSHKLDALRQMLGMTPKQPWNLAYAQMFDTEASLLNMFGQSPKHRPYSGTIDPGQAVKELAKVEDGNTPPAIAHKPAADPQTAVNLIAAHVRHIFENQRAGIDQATENLSEPPPPKEQSFWEKALDIAMTTALGGIAGAIGGAIADKLKRSLETMATKNASSIASDLVRLSTNEGASEALRTATFKRVMSDGAIARAMAVDGAKDAAKAFFKDSTSLALKGAKAEGTPSAKHPLTGFVQQQRNVNRLARQQSELLMVHLASSLAHLDLDTLNELHLHLGQEVVPRVMEQQYTASIRAWENLRAQLGAKDELAPDYGPARAPLRHVDGMLEARFVIDAATPLGHARPQSLKLRGGEAAAIEQLKKRHQSLDKLGMYVRFTAMFEPANHVSIDLAVGPDFRLLDQNLFDMRQLKIIAAKHPMSELHVLSAVAGEYDHISDADAIKVANQLIRNMAYISTAWLEES
jgi:hypothetical protein